MTTGTNEPDFPLFLIHLAHVRRGEPVRSRGVAPGGAFARPPGGRKLDKADAPDSDADSSPPSRSDRMLLFLDRDASATASRVPHWRRSRSGLGTTNVPPPPCRFSGVPVETDLELLLLAPSPPSPAPVRALTPLSVLVLVRRERGAAGATSTSMRLCREEEVGKVAVMSGTSRSRACGRSGSASPASTDASGRRA